MAANHRYIVRTEIEITLQDFLEVIDNPLVVDAFETNTANRNIKATLKHFEDAQTYAINQSSANFCYAEADKESGDENSAQKCLALAGEWKEASEYIDNLMQKMFERPPQIAK